jgi:gamma-glutamyl hercynylcysteine S-oxide hydrolase
VCRHLAYSGPPISLAEVLYDPPYSLLAQARAPRLQLYGDDNPDGFGVGWFPTRDDEPLTYRTTTPMWDDEKFVGSAREIRAEILVGAARLRSPGSPIELAAVAPLRSGRWLCSLNGIVDGFHDTVGDILRARLDDDRRAGLQGSADTEVCFELLLARMHAGQSAPSALASLLTDLETLTTGMFNFILTDGRELVASAVGNSLFVRCDPIVIASEPLDDDPAWQCVPDRSLVVTENGTVELVSLEVAA